MKGIRMFISVILAMVLMLSTFLFPASAAVIDDNTIEPQYTIVLCPACDRQTAKLISTNTTVLSREYVYKPVNGCEARFLDPHYHETTRRFEAYNCSYCGSVNYTATRIRCLATGRDIDIDIVIDT